jgi:hypothetical protein
MADVHEIVAARGHVADETGPVAKAGMQRQPATALSPRVEERSDLGRNPGLPQRRRDEPALPGFVDGRRHVLRGAAAAGAEIRAEGRRSLGRRRLDAHELGEAALPFDQRRLAGKREGHEERAGLGVRDAVAASAEPVDDDALSHAAPR